MSILEILEDHRQHDAVAKDTRFYCLCGWVSEMPRYGYGPAEHRAHVAQVLEQHEREAKAEAWDRGAVAAWERSNPEVNGSNYHWRSSGEPRNPYQATS